MLVSTAARPTTECKAATVWGSSVGVMRLPIRAPDIGREQTRLGYDVGSVHIPMMPPIAAMPPN